MPRARSPNRDKAKKIYTEAKGNIKLKDIADELKVSPSQIRKWKCIDRWDDKEEALPKQKKSSGNKSNKKKKSNKKSKRKKDVVENKILRVIEEADLTEKERLFCLCYIKNFNASSAALKAGYSPNSAGQIGYQLLQKTRIKNEIQQLKKIKAESIMISEDDIVERYMRIAFSDITDFISFGSREVIQYDADGEEFKEAANYLDLKDHSIVDGGLISEVKQTKQGVSIKLEDRLKALDWLSNYFEMKPDHKHKVWYDKEKLKLNQEEQDLRKKIEEKKNW